MFTDDQIRYMKRELGLNLNFSDLSDDDLIMIEETVGDRLALSGFDKEYRPTSDGTMCESIINALLKN